MQGCQEGWEACLGQGIREEVSTSTSCEPTSSVEANLIPRDSYGEIPETLLQHTEDMIMRKKHLSKTNLKAF
jgi:hypothetical protein